jgi:hypothetical protein
MPGKGKKPGKKNPGKQKIQKERKLLKKATNSVMNQVKGRGDYTAEGIGKWIGSGLGGMAGRLFKTVTGLGDYSVASKGTGPPMFNRNGAPVIEHREYLRDIQGSVDFTLTSFDLNPGQAKTFPWLANIASAFEEYRLLGCIFEFKSTSASALNSTNTALGSVIMATEYDVSDEPFYSKLGMENHQFATSSKPNLSMLHAIECAPAQTVVPQRWVRTGPVPSGADPKLYDWGRFSIATAGMQAVSTIGELWVTYRVQVLKPQLLNSALQASRQIGVWYGLLETTMNMFTNKFENYSVSTWPITLSGNTFTLTGLAPGVTFTLEIYWYTTPGQSAGTISTTWTGASTAIPTSGPDQTFYYSASSIPIAYQTSGMSGSENYHTFSQQVVATGTTATVTATSSLNQTGSAKILFRPYVLKNVGNKKGVYVTNRDEELRMEFEDFKRSFMNKSIIVTDEKHNI